MLWKTILCVLLGSFLSTGCCNQAQTKLYPIVKPDETGLLKVSDLHEIAWEVVGNRSGTPVIGLHGGPGGGISDAIRRFFDPSRFRIILFDQRGSGRSRPKAEWRENTTQDLIEDINRLRKHLGVSKKAIIWGGSWGSTLALAYAERYPDKVAGLVLRGVFLARRGEIDHFYHGGVAKFYPNNYKQLQELLPHPERLDYPGQLFEMTQSQDEQIRNKAILGWARYEIRMVSWQMTDEQCEQILKSYDFTSFSVLENHYMKSGCFLEEGQLLDEAEKIKHIPTYIVNGRYDMICPPTSAIELASRLQDVKLEIVEGAGHSYHEPAVADALIRGLDWVADRVGGH